MTYLAATCFKELHSYTADRCFKNSRAHLIRNPLHTVGPEANAESSGAQLQPDEHQGGNRQYKVAPYVDGISSGGSTPHSMVGHYTPECSAQPRQCSAARNTAHADITADSHSHPGCFTQHDQGTDDYHQQTNQVSLSKSSVIDAAEEEQLTLDYQSGTIHKIPEHHSVCILASSRKASRSPSIANGSDVGKRKCQTVPQNSHRQRVWRNKHYRRDGVMDLWSRAGLQLQSKAMDK